MINKKDLELDTPYWCVYGSKYSPSILCFKLHFWKTDLPSYKHLEAINIWGYSVYKRKPGFRTLGIKFDEWCNRDNSDKKFFTSINTATDYIKSLVTPKIK